MFLIPEFLDRVEDNVNALPLQKGVGRAEPEALCIQQRHPLALLGSIDFPGPPRHWLDCASVRILK
jgi:hypothetical protein